MSSYISAIREALTDIILEALPEYAEGGVWLTTHITRRPAETLKPPYVVIELDRLDPDTDGEYSPVNLAYTLSPAIYILRLQSWDGLEIAEDLERLRDAFKQQGMIAYGGDDVAQIISIGGLDWGESLEPNQFADSKNVMPRAGAISITLQVGESLND